MEIEWNIDFYLCAIVLLVVLIIYHYATPHYRSTQNRLYGVFLIGCFLACIFDVMNSLVYVYYPKQVWLLRGGYMVYFLVQHSLPPLYWLYIVVGCRGNQGHIEKRDWIFLVPAFLLVWINTLSFFNGWVYQYTLDRGYERGPVWIILLPIGCFYLCASCVQVIRNRKKLSRMFVVSAPMYLLLNVFFITIQTLYPDVLILGASGALCCFLVYLGMQNPNMLKEAIQNAEEAKQLAEEANRSKSNFLANMSHEIRTPMNAIYGMTELLSQGNLDELEKDYVHTIQTASKSLMEIINSILDVSKVDAGRVELIPVEYDFAELLNETEQIIASRASQKNLEFYIDINPEIPRYLYGDNLKIKQILINILNNAVKFTDKGEIRLSIDFDKTYDKNEICLIFKITDTGVGIREEDMDKLFTQFAQVNARKNRKVEGTGLGLPLAKAYSELMGGDVQVSSIYGRGSCFTVTLLQSQSANADRGTSEEYEKPGCIYVLSDKTYYQKQIKEILESCKCVHSHLDSVDELPKDGNPGDMLWYAYEEFHQDMEELGTACSMKKIAFLNFYTSVKKQDDETVYIRKPLEYYRVQELFVRKQDLKLQDTETKKCVDLSGMRVAVVDDSRVNLRIAKAFLDSLHVASETYISGTACIEALKKDEKFDVIFMDHMMPDLDGVEATRIIRQMDTAYCKNVPIIALTANAISGVEQEYLEAGMNGCLFKPLVMDNLRTELQKWVVEV